MWTITRNYMKIKCYNRDYMTNVIISYLKDGETVYKLERSPVYPDHVRITKILGVPRKTSPTPS